MNKVLVDRFKETVIKPLTDGAKLEKDDFWDMKLIEKPDTYFYENLVKCINLYGVEPFIEMSNKSFSFLEDNTYIEYVYNDKFRELWFVTSLTYERYIELLKKYPEIYEFFKEHDMLNHPEILSELYNTYFIYGAKECIEHKDLILENLLKIRQLNVDFEFLLGDARNCYGPCTTHLVYDITDDEKLVQIKKILCQRKMSYKLREQEVFNIDKRVYRHEIYHTEYDYNAKDLEKGINEVYDKPGLIGRDGILQWAEFDNAPKHGWSIIALNDGEKVLNHMAVVNLSLCVFKDDEPNLPTKEEIDSLELPEGLEEYRKKLKKEHKLKETSE